MFLRSPTQKFETNYEILKKCRLIKVYNMGFSYFQFFLRGQIIFPEYNLGLFFNNSLIIRERKKVVG